MSASDKPRLAGRQPSIRGGVPRVKTWSCVNRRTQARITSRGDSYVRPIHLGL